MSDSFTKTGTFLTAEQIEKVREAYHEAETTPVIALSSAQALGGQDFASQAWMRFHRLLYDFALVQGLPEIEGWYGLNMKSGEVLGPGVG